MNTLPPIHEREDYDLHKSLAREIWLLIKDKTPETEEGRTIYNLLNSPRKLRQFLEELAQKHQALAYRFRHVPLFPNPDEPYNFNMNNSDPILQALEGIHNTLQQMNKQLKKLDKLDKLDDMDKKLGKIYDVLITTKAEISEKGIFDIFRRFLKEDKFTSIKVIKMDMGEEEEGKADFYIEAEREGRKYRFVLEVKNYLEDGENFRFIEILKNLKKRAEKWGAIPVLGARYMTTSARCEALNWNIWVLTYNDQTYRMELIKR